MLSRRPSLKLSAALIFLGIYIALFVAGFMLLRTASLSVREDHHAGPSIALGFAGDELREVGNSLRFPKDGAFAQLAARNPSLWLLAEIDGRRFAFGPVPAQAKPLFGSYAGVLVAGKFHVPGVARPLSDAAFVRMGTGPGSLALAAGGVDPGTVSLAQSFHYFLNQGLVMILLLAAIGLATMLAALPLLTAALRKVTADAAAITPDRPDLRIREARVPSELFSLVRGFNSALDRLADELVRRKRFVADIAHELRTPLAIASLQVDELEEGEPKEGLQRVMSRLSNLVAQMLDVERLSLTGQHRSELNLTVLARDTVVELAPMALGAGYELSFEAPEVPVIVSGDAHALGRAIGNLIGNAVAHAGGKGQIRVVVSEQRRVEVIDEGPGIAASIGANLFEPFCRERWDRDGCGLGLHLTREIMRAHGGDAELLPSAAGAAFRLQFV